MNHRYITSPLLQKKIIVKSFSSELQWVQEGTSGGGTGAGGTGDGEGTELSATKDCVPGGPDKDGGSGATTGTTGGATGAAGMGTCTGVASVGSGMEGPGGVGVGMDRTGATGTGGATGTS